MRFEILIHGKPSEAEMICSGQIGAGIEEQVYKEFFGSNLKPSVSPCFVYEIRKWKGTLYSIYSIYNDGKDSFGSGNGYCVVSLIVDGYFSDDFVRINDLLKQLYSSLLYNNIIDDSGKYLVRTLKNSVDLIVLNDIVKDFIGTMRFMPIDTNETFGRPSDNAICLNLKDANPQLVYSGLKEQGRVYVSSKYKSLEQLEKERLQRQAETEIARKPIMKKTANDEGERIHVDKFDARTLESLSRKIDLLLQRVPADKAGGFPFSNSADERPDTNHVKNSFKGVSIFNWVTVVNCVLLLLCLFRCNPSSHNNTDKGYTSATLNDSTRETEDAPLRFTQNDFSILQRENEELKHVISILENSPEISIDIDGISNGEIKLGKSYKLTLLQDNQVVPISIGTLKCDEGLTIDKNEDGNYSITGIELGSQRISCYIGDYLLINREIKVVRQ